MAKDYFSLGSNSPLSKALFDWVEKGFHTLVSMGGHLSNDRSWRFWMKGPQKEYIVCGVLRDSSDSFGRPYPFLILGTGFLKGWEDRWDLLPFTCEVVWNQMEYISIKRFTDFTQFENEISLIRPPSPHWSEFVAQRDGLSYGDFQELREKSACLSKKTEFCISLDNEPSADHFTVLGLWYFFLKTHTKIVPNAVFMGGNPEKTYLAVFKRPLIPDDFVQLWSESRMKHGF